MKYLGHFSFVEYSGDEISHGLLSAVVSADDIDSATVRFHNLMEQKKSEAGAGRWLAPRDRFDL